MAEYLSEEDMNTGEYISRDIVLRQINATCLAISCDNYNGVMCRACAYADTMDFIIDLPAADVKPVTQTENMSTIAFCDRFICKNCDIHLENWVKVVIDPDDGEALHYKYEFKFCPECGAKIVEEDKK